MKKLPIGIYTFSEIIKNNYIYIDKTQIAHNLIEASGKYFFLSRPRRFGKSLFLDTLKEIFLANKDLFEGLDIYDNYDWDLSYPVINISFAQGNIYSEENFEEKIKLTLKKVQEELDVECDKNLSPSSCFSELIRKIYIKYNQKVVILIDEYDKPILDNLQNTKLSLKMRDKLRDFYSVIKGSDEYLRFAFLTGVSKFSKASIFSGLNNLQDISLDKRYGNICGYTQKDIENSFLPYLKGVDLDELKKWYNGYNFLKDSVYNPFDILLFIDRGFEFKNYWFETGTPSFLIEMIKKYKYNLANLENLSVGEELISSFDIENLSIETLLFQTGYLAIKSKQNIMYSIEYTLSLPNREVRIALNDYILSQTTNNPNPMSIKKPIFLALKTKT